MVPGATITGCSAFSIMTPMVWTGRFSSSLMGVTSRFGPSLARRIMLPCVHSVTSTGSVIRARSAEPAQAPTARLSSMVRASFSGSFAVPARRVSAYASRSLSSIGTRATL